MITSYDANKITTAISEYEVYLSGGIIHPLLFEIIKWGEGDKTLQELYTDLLVYENALLKK